ncbi:Sec63 Brl domain-containing protein [Ochromonadaceae sp. CCMP2298]|nr:Sec63 Brl domain-containing protein [Ochromonadaceae sp. CCMP2298]
MADEFLRSKQYEYGANSNLVLEAERGRGSRIDEGKGEVETLNGKLGNVRMGEKLAQRARPELDDKLQKAKAKRQRTEAAEELNAAKKKTSSSIFVAGKGASILSQLEDMDASSYRPKTRETREAYEELLREMQLLIGDQPQDILKGAADEVLSVLKDDSMRDPQRHKELMKISPRFDQDRFHRAVNVGKRITDYNVKEEVEEEEAVKMDEEMAVVFEYDDDEDMVDRDEGGEGGSEEDDDEDGVEANAKGMLKGEEDDVGPDQDVQYNVNIHDIDAHWLQRQLSRYYPDANVSADLAEAALKALADERACENKLVVLLDFDKFEFIKLLMKNRAKIYYCTRLKQAQSEEERAVVEEEMLLDSESGGPQLLQLITQKASAENWAQDRIGEFASKAKREARALRKGTAVEEDGEGAMDFESAAEPLAKLVVADKFLNLDDLTFGEGGHLMTNKRCELPDKSWRAQKKGYEEVHVPALRPVIPAGEKLVDVLDLPEWMQPAFGGIRALNRVQSKMMSAALDDTQNLLLCAPTGAGKTNVALMCMLNQLAQSRREDGTFDLDSFKIVYVAPMKALVQECVLTFGKKLAPFGVVVKELSGDQNLTRQQIQETQVIITTPEKWDIITRKSGERTYTQLVRLMIIDEIHLLHDDRGPVVESLVARTIRQIESTQESVRLVGLSATLPNYEDVAAFLRVDPDKGLFFFDNSYRPVPLQQQYIGITEKKALKRFQLMNEICYEKVLQQAGKNQVLIFTHSRAETAKTALALKELAEANDTLSRFVREDSASLEILRLEGASAKNTDLQELLPFGFAIHHAGMVRSDRTLVEDLFSDKHVQVLVSTATLAWGVNLPCHTVILKGTQMYDPEQGRWVELSPLDIMQMLGRAGRYGLDTEGEGIIMTQHSELQFYLSLMNQQLPIESQFIKKLPDMLNAEVVLGSVSSVKEAASWLGYTYLYVRMLRNPSLYGVTPEAIEKDPTLLQRRIDLAHAAATLLDKHGLLKYDRRTGSFLSTALGRVASYYYVSHETVSTFNANLKPSMNDIEIFRLFSLSGEFKQIHVREEEKLELQKLVQRVPVPVKEGVEEASAKVNVLLQAYISRLKLEGFALVADMAFVQQSACRLMRAIFEIALKRGWAALASKVLQMCKMVERRTWGSQSPLRQFGNIPEVIVRKLEKNSDISWDRYFDLKPADLGEMVKIPKMGKTLYKFVHMFPRVALNAHILPVTRSLLKIDLTITPDFEFDPKVHDNLLFWVIVEDVDGEQILHHEPFILRSQNAADEHVVNFTVPMLDPMPPQYFIKVVSDRWMHSEAVLPVSFRHLILPQKFPPPAELLDLQPLPVGALRNPVFESLYPRFSHFNPIQTQTFSTLFETDENALVCAPAGSGKSACAEFAILRLFKKDPAARCVYVSPRQEVAEATYRDWLPRLGEKLGVSVVLLTGEASTDLNLLNNGSIIVSAAVPWDTLSRRWKQRKSIQNVSLYIFDHLELIGGDEGPTTEIVVSRARFVASQLEKSVRIVGLAASLANAKDMGDWIGAAAHGVYNFAPDVRPVPLEVLMLSYDTNHASSRLLAMAKPAYNAIVKHSPSKPVIVFVPSKKQAQLTAIDMLSFAAASGQPGRFLHPSPAASIESLVEGLADRTVAQTLLQGVGFLHGGMSKADRERVEALVLDGVVQVLVVPHALCWSLRAVAHMVVVMDTTYYEGREHRYVDYGITDLLHMLGRASRQGQDASSKCLVMCHSPKRGYLKKLLHEPLPIESHLDHCLHDHINAEIVTRTVENMPDAVDYLTWTFFYRRLTQNPNYYSLQGASHRHLSDHLSQLIEDTIADLEESKCVAIDEEIELSPLNLGMISSHYYIQYTTVELFASSVTAKSKARGVVEVLAAASEFSRLTIRAGEEAQLQRLAKHLPHPVPAQAKWEDPATKALVLLQAHFSRFSLTNDLNADLGCVLGDAVKLLQALVDVISSQGWLKPALAAMEVSQMCVQGMWAKDSYLLQVPHFDARIVAELKALPTPVESVFDVLEMEDEVRNRVLQMGAAKLSDVATFCNAYPNIEVQYEMDIDGEVVAGDAVTMKVTLKREVDEEEDEVDTSTLGVVVAPRYPTAKREGWWLVIGDVANNNLLSIKRVALALGTTVKLEFPAPETPGDYNLVLYAMCDSYLGCDQEYEFNICVVPDDGEMGEGEEEEKGEA